VSSILSAIIFRASDAASPKQHTNAGSRISKVLAHLLPATGSLHGGKPNSIDAGIYGFIAKTHFYPIETPLKQFVMAHDNIVRHCEAIHAAVSAPPDPTG
jgi:hypothetical protein